MSKHPTLPSTPTLTQVERLLEQRLLETDALQIVRQLLLAEQASVPPPVQLPAPVSNGHAKTRTVVRRAVHAAAKTNGAATPKVAPRTIKLVNEAKTRIIRSRLTLFLLEHLDQPRTYEWLLASLKETGHANHIDRIGGAIGALNLKKWVTRSGDQYKLTSAGSTAAKKLRGGLEKLGACTTGGYLAPASYSAAVARQEAHIYSSL